jgi:hypothetical protein
VVYMGMSIKDGGNLQSVLVGESDQFLSLICGVDDQGFPGLLVTNEVTKDHVVTHLKLSDYHFPFSILSDAVYERSKYSKIDRP